MASSVAVMLSSAASALGKAKVPCSRRRRYRAKPSPCQARILSRSPRRFLKTNKSPDSGSRPSCVVTTADRPSKLLRPSTGWTHTQMRPLRPRVNMTPPSRRQPAWPRSGPPCRPARARPRPSAARSPPSRRARRGLARTWLASLSRSRPAGLVAAGSGATSKNLFLASRGDGKKHAPTPRSCARRQPRPAKTARAPHRAEVYLTCRRPPRTRESHQSNRSRKTPLQRTLTVSLQKGFGTEQLVQVRFDVTALEDEWDRDGEAFLDTAAIMKNLDLVVTADTASGHLAGALDVPVWVALAKIADWRWLTRWDNTPWYPTMRLFRQPSLGDWTAVFARMAAELRNVADQKQGRLIPVEITPGELADKISILEIKAERIKDEAKLVHVRAELT